MIAAYIPDQGDLIMLDFDPSAGTEIMKTRPAFVLSRRAFNEHTGFAIVAPITSTIRNIRLEVVLPSNMKTTGSILVHQIRSLDFSARRAALIEHAPEDITKDVIEIAKLIIS